MPARFGPAGNSDSFHEIKGATSLDVPKWLSERGLDAYEYQCGRGVNIGRATAEKLGARAREYGVALSLHSPYYISLSNSDPKRIEANIGYILQSVEAADWMGATRVVVHSGSAGVTDREKALKDARSCILQALSRMEAHGLAHVSLCLETMGKVKTFGTLNEVARLCLSDKRLIPCVDFGHLNARLQGGMMTVAQVTQALNDAEDILGPARMRNLHVHFSKIEYSQHGEVRHLTFSDAQFGPDPDLIMDLLRARGYEPFVICESAGTQAEDALYMKKAYFAAQGAE